MTTATVSNAKTQSFVGHGSITEVFRVINMKITEEFPEETGLLCLEYEEGNMLFEVKRVADGMTLGTVRVTHKQLENDNWRGTERHAVKLLTESA